VVDRQTDTISKHNNTRKINNDNTTHTHTHTQQHTHQFHTQCPSTNTHTVHTHTHTHIHKFTHTHTHTHTQANTHTHTRKHTHKTHMCTHTHNKNNFRIQSGYRTFMFVTPEKVCMRFALYDQRAYFSSNKLFAFEAMSQFHTARNKLHIPLMSSDLTKFHWYCGNVELLNTHTHTHTHIHTHIYTHTHTHKHTHTYTYTYTRHNIHTCHALT